MKSNLMSDPEVKTYHLSASRGKFGMAFFYSTQESANVLKDFTKRNHQVTVPVCGSLEHACEMQTRHLEVEEYFDSFLML